MQCRSDCGACCIAPSISTPIPGMPNGKLAGQTCVQLTEDNKCKIFNQRQRPQVCSKFRPEQDVCGETREQALKNINLLENSTK